MEIQDRFLQSLFHKFPLSSLQGKESALFQEKLLREAIPEDLATEIHSALDTKDNETVSDILEYRLLLLSKMHESWCGFIENALPPMLQPLAKTLFLYRKKSGEEDSFSSQETSKAADIDQLEGISCEKSGIDSATVHSINPDFASFCLNELLDRSKIFQRQPITDFAESSLSWLVDISYQDLITVIDLVAMVDVTEEIRQIVDKKTLQSVLSVLSDIQQRYLKALLYMHPKIAREPIEILQKIRQGIKKELLRSHVHQRGLQRLSLALKNETSSLIWYVIHKLDVARGQYLEKSLITKDMASPELGFADVKSLFTHAYQFVLNEREIVKKTR